MEKGNVCHVCLYTTLCVMRRDFSFSSIAGFFLFCCFWYVHTQENITYTRDGSTHFARAQIHKCEAIKKMQKERVMWCERQSSFSLTVQQVGKVLGTYIYIRVLCLVESVRSGWMCVEWRTKVDIKWWFEVIRRRRLKRRWQRRWLLLLLEFSAGLCDFAICYAYMYRRFCERAITYTPIFHFLFPLSPAISIEIDFRVFVHLMFGRWAIVVFYIKYYSNNFWKRSLWARFRHSVLATAIATAIVRWFSMLYTFIVYRRFTTARTLK